MVSLMPDMYRMVSLRSVVAEASERMFHELRLVNIVAKSNSGSRIVFQYNVISKSRTLKLD